MRAREIMFDPEWLRLLANRSHRAAAHRLKSFTEERLRQLPEEERSLALRARRLQRFLTHPYRCVEPFNGIPGRYVSIEDTLSGVEEIIAGGLDRVDEKRLQFIGGLSELQAS